MERERATKFIHELLDLLVKQKGSDLFITAGFPPAIKVDGKITPVSKTALTPQHTIELVRSVMNDKQAAEFEVDEGMQLRDQPAGHRPLPRQRLRAAGPRRHGAAHDHHRHPEVRGARPAAGAEGRDHVASAASCCSSARPAPASRRRWRRCSATATRTATATSSRSRTRSSSCTSTSNCIITQREVGVDTDGWQIALKNSLRQAPDVILIGEVRERETMDYAIAFAETGHLCLATLHANSTNQALDRIINFFPEERRAQLLMDLSLNIRAFVAQRLIPRRDGRGRVPAVEVMLNSPLISDLIFKGDVSGIKEIMKKSRELGMQTFDQSLFDLYEGGPHHLRGRAAQRRFAERPAARDQAARQGSEEPQRLLRHRQSRHRPGRDERPRSRPPAPIRRAGDRACAGCA